MVTRKDRDGPLGWMDRTVSVTEAVKVKQLMSLDPYMRLKHLKSVFHIFSSAPHTRSMQKSHKVEYAQNLLTLRSVFKMLSCFDLP